MYPCVGGAIKIVDWFLGVPFAQPPMKNLRFMVYKFNKNIYMIVYIYKYLKIFINIYIYIYDSLYL